MKKLLLLILHFTFYILHSYSQAPLIQWQKSYGGTNVDQANSVIQTADGGYLIGGVSRSADGDLTFHHGPDTYPDYWLVKTDASGTIQWQKIYGGSSIDWMFSVIEAGDGGYLLTGWTYSTDGDVTGTQALGDDWIVKIDSAGTIQWQNTMGGSGADEGIHAVRASDGGFIISGTSGSTNGDVTGNHGFNDYWLVKLDTGGTIKWQKCFGGSRTEEEASLQQTSDGGYILAGTSFSNDGDITNHHGTTSTRDVWVVKTDSARTIQWQHSFGGIYDEHALEVKQTTDGGYLVVGTSNSNDGDVSGHHGALNTSDVWVFKLDTGGILKWQKCYGGTGDDEGNWISLCNDGGFVVAGFTTSINGDVTANNGNEDNWLLKADSLGTIQWQRTMGGSLDDEATAVEQTTDGGFIVCGFSNSNDFDVSGNHGDFDWWVVKLTAATAINETDNRNFPALLSPNPFHTSATLQFPSSFFKAELKIYNVLGEEVKRKMIAGETTVINREGLGNGIYFYRAMNQAGESVSGKFVVE